jgi:hypothetical protein
MNSTATSTKGRKIVRTKYAGVFFATVEHLDEATGTAVLTEVRRLWYWKGAATLSELAQAGTKRPSECKFPEPVDRTLVREVIEVLDVTEKAAASIDAVPVWVA